MRIILPSFIVNISKDVKQAIGATLRSEYGLRIDAITPGGLVDKTNALQPFDRIVKINGQDVTEALSPKQIESLFAVRSLELTVSRFTGAELEAAKKKIEEEAAKKDAELHKYGDIEAIKRFVTETEAKCTSEGQEKVLAECQEILFFRDLAKLAVDVMKEAKKEFATRWTVKKMLCASTYKERLDNFKSDIEK
jgi:hypothetical protein